MTLSEILHVLSDEECFKMLQKTIENKSLKVEDYQTRKRFYRRLAMLKQFDLIKKVGQNYRATTLGTVLYGVLETAQTTCSLSWRLKVIDEIANMPQKEKENIIRMIIPDEDVRRVLNVGG